MAKDRRPATPGWKKNVNPGQASQAAVPDWKRDKTAAPGMPKKGLSRRTKLFLAMAAFSFAVAGIIGLIWLIWPPKPACVVLLGAGYEENPSVPPNVYGRENLDDYTAIAGSGNQGFLWWQSGLFSVRQPPKMLRRGEPWDTALDSSISEQTILVVMNLHGGLDSKGPYLLRDNAQPAIGEEASGDSKQWNRLYVEEIIDRLADPRLKDKHKLLILDATQVVANWPYGMLHNDFARGLRGLEAKIKNVPNLVVICSSDVDQRSWCSEERRRSVFGFYVVEGLKGRADKDDRFVSAAELFDFVHDKVERWVRDNRNELQTPFLIGDKALAGRMKLIHVDKTPEANDPPAGQAPAIPEEMNAAWKKYAELGEQTPSPAAYAPQYWRRYGEVLLRLEDLYRAGATAHTATWKTELSLLEGKIEKARLLKMESAPYSLALTSAAGATVPPKVNLSAEFDRLWNAVPAELDATWKDVQRVIPEDAMPLLAGQLLQRAIENPNRNLEKARQLLHLIYGADNRRPTEIHFLKMLVRDQPKDRPPELIELALKTHRLAEQAVFGPPNAFAYSEEVFPWIEAKVKKADERRRAGEDRLFDASPEAQTKARIDLDAANKDFEAALEDAEVIRSALQVRNEVLAYLPFYSDWAAQRTLDARGNWEAIKQLWDDTHQLMQLLESRDLGVFDKATPTALDPKGRGLKTLSRDVREGFAQVEVFHKDFAQKVLKSDEKPGFVREANEALRVTRLEPRVRRELLDHSRKISGRLLSGGASAAEGVTEAQNNTMAQDAAHRQGMLALATLGPRWFDDKPKDLDRTWKTYAEVQVSLQGVRTDKTNWPALVGPAGEQVSYRWCRLPKEVGDLTQSSETASLPTATTNLQRGDRLSRQICGALVTTKELNPAEEYRRLQWHNLLLAQARRTRENFWASESTVAGAAHYYRAAGLAYVADAGLLVDKNPRDAGEGAASRRQAYKKAEEELNKEPRFHVALTRPLRLPRGGSVNQVHVTSENDLTLEYEVRADADVPVGHPAFWFTVQNPLALADANLSQPHTRDLTANQRTLAIRCQMTSPLAQTAETKPPDYPKRSTAEAKLIGRFRGHKLDDPTIMHLHPMPETIVYDQPPPLRAGIIVRADKNTQKVFGSGTIALILDCSGSMWEWDEKKWAERKKRGEKQRFDEAREGLDRLLAGLPAGTKVSLWVYGQEDPKDNANKTVHKRIKRLTNGVEDWDPINNPNQHKDLMDKVWKLKPYGMTPVARSIKEASVDVLHAEGFKTIVVLTDGEDTQFEPNEKFKKDPAGPDPDYNPKGDKKIPDFLMEQFKDTGIQINIVAFQVTKEEEALARSQFEKAIGDKTMASGKFYKAEKVADLVTELQQAIKQKLRFWVYQNGVLVSGFGKEGRDVTEEASTSPSPVVLKPGSYELEVQTDKRLPPQRFSVERGEVLMVELVRAGEKYGFRQSLYGHRFGKPNVETPDRWRLTGLQNQLLQSGAGQMLVGLERIRDVEEAKNIIQPTRPRFTWIELEAAEPKTHPITVRWGAYPGMPAPMWSLDVRKWPNQAGSDFPAITNLNVWFSAGTELASSANLERKSATWPLDFKEEFISLDGKEEILIESIQLEKHWIVTKFDAEPVEEECLVVRLTYPKGKPVFIELDPLPSGYEHRYYPEANKYTGIFWPIGKARAADLRSLKIYSIDRFKNSKTTTKTELKLDKPQADDTRQRHQPFKDLFAPDKP